MAAIDALFDELVKRGGGELHLSASEPPLGRVDGELVALRTGALTAREVEELLFELTTPAQRARLASELCLELAVARAGAGRFRGTYYVKHSGLAAAFRLVPSRRSFADLGCPDVVGKLADLPRGLVLVAGPADSGKTTTAAALVDRINATRACHVVALGAPLEVVHEPSRAHLTQREIGTHAPTLAAALDQVSREAADVVVTPDLSGAEEIDRALRLAADGLLVLSTFRARSAVDALERLTGAFPASERQRVRARLASSLGAVVAQRLVRASDARTRVAAFEILVGTESVRALLREGVDAEALTAAIAAGQAAGMQALDDGLERLVKGGTISREAALAHAIDPQAFGRRAPSTPS